MSDPDIRPDWLDPSRLLHPDEHGDMHVRFGGSRADSYVAFVTTPDGDETRVRYRRRRSGERFKCDEHGDTLECIHVQACRTARRIERNRRAYVRREYGTDAEPVRRAIVLASSTLRQDEPDETRRTPTGERPSPPVAVTAGEGSET